jgi:hypothetical protein
MMHSPKNIKKGEKELYMTEGYDSLVLKIE